MTTQTKRTSSLLLGFACSIALALPAAAHAADDAAPAAKTARADKASHGKKLDRSGKPRKGKASFYAKRFAGRKMADGTPMNPNANIAASRTLPLGTKAEVVNLENGKSTVVEIRDRGPYVDGRIVDLTPKVARDLDFVEDGVAPVEVRPIELPPAGESQDTAQR